MKLRHTYFKNSVATAMAMIIASPSHAALGLLNIPPQAVIPPVPNVIVTLDDSGSMTTAVAYDPTITYVIPPNSNGISRLDGGGQPRAYNNGYADPQPAIGTVDLSGSTTQGDGFDVFRVAFQARPLAERQNYANWFSYYRNRNMSLKAATMRSFSPQIVPDGRMRVAWQQLNANCNSFTNTNGCTNNRMKSLEGAQRNNFFNWVRGLPASGGTPLRAVYARAGEYLKTTGTNSPYAFDPGTTQAPTLSCRRSYHVLFTDGGWNGASSDGNEDSIAVTLPDGVPYTVTAPYRGRTDADGVNTLADVAFRYWANDLQPTLTNDVRTSIKKSGVETYGTTTLSEYWNPKNNPAKWQHMTLYAVGFGEAGNLAAGAAPRNAAAVPTFTGTTTGGASFAEIVSGTRQWPLITNEDWRAWDLWHAAVNARGEMFPAKTPDQVVNAFQKIVSEILAGGEPTGGASSSLSFTPDFVAIQSGYNGSPTWRGTLRGFDQNSGVIGTTPLFEAHNVITSQSASSRVVLTASSPTSGAPFQFSNLSAFQRDMLNRSTSYIPDGFGNQRLSYLRGSRENEATGTVIPIPSLRNRDDNILGTIVNSEPRLVGKPRAGFFDASYKAFRDSLVSREKIVYVGANDGMMHGVSADDGSAKMSYVPRGVFGRLSEYTDPSYQHKYFVDGAVIPGDAKIDGAWRTLLIGALGAGGRGIYALDVTNPAAFSESNAASVVKFDYTAPSENLAAAVPAAASLFASESAAAPFMSELSTDMGHIMGDGVRDAQVGRSLQIAQLQNGRWAFITGNGVNSVNEKAVLYIIYLDAAGGYQKIVADNVVAGNNGLSVPLPLDTNGDGKVDVIYAGDLKGRLWKFTSNAAGTFSLANSGAALVNVGKPITSAPTLASHPRGGFLVTFGTGRLYTVTDKTDVSTQSIYGVWDKPGVTGTVALTDLVDRTLSGDVAGATGGQQVRTISGGAIDYSAKRGWKMNLKPGERVIFNPVIDGPNVFYSTFVPVEGQSCVEGSAAGSLLGFDVIYGSASSIPAFDVNDDGKFTKDDWAATDTNNNSVAGLSKGIGKLAGLITAGRIALTDPSNPAQQGPTQCRILGSDGNRQVGCLTGPGRVLWRDLTP
jgi:type IV pilus assembly protein PilY1